MVGVDTAADKGFQDRRLRLLDLQDQGVVLVSACQQHDVTTGADAAHPDHLASGVDISELLERVVFDAQGPAVRRE